jgi:hypothetical protein
MYFEGADQVVEKAKGIGRLTGSEAVVFVFLRGGLPMLFGVSEAILGGLIDSESALKLL